jgi:hypothetical protein
MGRVRATILGSENKPDLVGAVFNAIRNRYKGEIEDGQDATEGTTDAKGPGTAVAPPWRTIRSNLSF